jgi:hypothetical protein
MASRAAPLLFTTMLVTAPAWAQSAPATTAPTANAPATAEPSSIAPEATTAPGATTADKPATRTRAAAPRHPGESMESLVDRRIADLHSKLHITSQQSQQWDQFTHVMRDNAKGLDGLYKARAANISGMSAVDNMQSYAQIEQRRAQDVEKLVPAFQTLYASLSDQQKKTADQLFRNYSANAQRDRTTTR